MNGTAGKENGPRFFLPIELAFQVNLQIGHFLLRPFYGVG